MSTHCTIAIKRQDGYAEGIYVQWDGYPEWTGRLLLENFNTKELAEKLIFFGDASILYPELEPKPGEKHTFQYPQKNVSVFYHRDRREPWETVKPRVCWYELLPEIFEQHYNYVFCDGSWYMWLRKQWYNKTDSERLIPLANAVKKALGDV